MWSDHPELEYPQGIWSSITSVANIVPLIGNAWSGLKFLYGISDTDDLKRGLERLAHDIRFLMNALAQVQSQLNAHAERLAKAENEQRLSDFSDLAVEIDSLMFKLLREDDAHELSAIAHEASLWADRLLNLNLWLWTDTILIPEERNDSGNITPERLELAPPDVKVAVVLPLYGYALVVTSLAAEAHVQKEFGGGGEKMRELYGPFIDRHIEALSLPQGWSDTNQRELEGDHTIQQRIRSRISAHVVPQSKYSNNGICRFDVVVVNGLLRTVTKSHEVQSEHPEGGNNILCTYPESILSPEEKDAEDSDLSLLYVAQLFELLESLKVRGSVPRIPRVGRFSEWTAAQADIYWTREDRFTKMARQIWPRNIPDFDEVFSFPQPWEVAKHVPGGGTIIYGGMPDGTWLWWRHTGAEQPELRDTWSGGSPVLMADRGLPWVRSRRVFGGGDGVLYGVAQRDETIMLADGTSTAFVRKGDLMWMRHDGFITGSGAFSPERKIATGWDAYTQLFSMGEGILYSISADGFLHWHKHQGWRSGVGHVDGHMIVGNGWFGISHVFGAGNGLIYARDTAGRMFCYRHLGWRDGSNRYEDRVEIIDLFPEKLLAIFASLPSSELFDPPG